MTEPTGLLPALLAVQAEAPTLAKDGKNPAFKGSKYTKLDTIVETMTPILTKHGLVWTTKPSFNDAGAATLKYKLAHAASGETEEGEMLLLSVKNDPQGQGSGITYARRYALCAVLNLVADDDDDGNNASSAAKRGPTLASAPQKQKLRGEITRNKLNADVMDALFKGVGFARQDGEKANDALNRLTSAQCSQLIDEISKGAIRTGGSDVPGAADGEFVVPAGGATELGGEA